MSDPGAPAAASPTPPAATQRALWRNRDYMLLWSGQVISTLGNTISGITLPLLVLAVTGSPEVAGISAALFSLPYVLFSLLAGALIDRWDRKRVMILCDCGRAVLMGSIPVALFFNLLTPWQIYVVAFCEGTLFVFFNIAEIAALPRVVSKEQLPNAAAQNQATFSAASLIGPAIGGFLFESVGRAIPFIADAVSYVVSVVTLLGICAPFQAQQTARPRNLRAEIAEGVRWVWNQPVIRFMAFITGGLNFVGEAIILIVIVLAKNQGAGESEIGIIFSIAAVGGLAGATIAGQIQQRFGFGQVVLSTIWIQALFFPLYLLVPSVWLLGGVTLVMLATAPIYNVAQISYRLSQVPDGLQGRVNSAVRLVHYGFQPLGATVAGILLERTGAATTVVVFSVWLIGLAALATLYPAVRRAGHAEDVAAQAT